MVVTRDIVRFVNDNDAEMRALFASRTGIHDKEVADEIMARTYASMVKQETLTKWDPRKGRYETYVATVMFWAARKMGDENDNTVCIDSIVPPSVDPVTDPCRVLHERLYDYNKYLTAQVGVTGAYEVGCYIKSKVEGYADRELGIDTARLRRTHKQWVARYSSSDPS